jgi:tetraacyldisaccharide-1-P 4'-kinase
LAALVREAGASHAAALITTGKDWARLGEAWDADLPLWVLEVEARIDQVERLMELLARLW